MLVAAVNGGSPIQGGECLRVAVGGGFKGLWDGTGLESQWCIFFSVIHLYPFAGLHPGCLQLGVILACLWVSLLGIFGMGGLLLNILTPIAGTLS